jgi:hypothetical protein
MTSMVTNLGLGAPPAAPQVSAGGFDAAWYLSHYPDVAQAIQAGIIRTPEEHYQIWGQKEGRMPNGDTLKMLAVSLRCRPGRSKLVGQAAVERCHRAARLLIGCRQPDAALRVRTRCPSC